MSLFQKITTYVLFLFVICLSSIRIDAQEISDYSKFEAKDFQNLHLPPLSLLFENVKNSPNYEYENINIEIQKKLLAKQKRDFLSFFSIRGSYQYGRVANDMYYSDVYTPATTNFSSATQNLYSVGAGMSISLDKLFDIKPGIRRQQLAVRSAELERDMKYEELKKQIIELYSNVLLQISTLKLNNEVLVQTTAQYEIAENNFVNGKITPADLAITKATQSTAKQQYETCKYQLIRDMMTLELITHTSFTKK